MTIQVHVPPGQASGSGSIWHSHRAQVLHYFLALCLWGPARSGGPRRLGVHPEVSGEPSPAAWGPRWKPEAERKRPGRPPRSQPPPRSSRGPRTMRPPAPAALTTQVSAPSAPARLVLAMAAPPAPARGCCSRSGAARARRSHRPLRAALRAPSRAPWRAGAAEEAAPSAALKLERGARA